jgi:hypothetical protein
MPSQAITEHCEDFFPVSSAWAGQGHGVFKLLLLLSWMNVGEYICSLPPHIALPGIFQGRVVLEVQDPATVQHILNSFNIDEHREFIAHWGAPEDMVAAYLDNNLGQNTRLAWCPRPSHCPPGRAESKLGTRR